MTLSVFLLAANLAWAGSSDTVHLHLFSDQFDVPANAVPGDYTLNVAVGDTGTNLDRIDNAIRFSVLPANIYNTGMVPRRKDGLEIGP